jgi:hypothetical protein
MTENGVINTTRNISIDSILYNNREDVNRYDTELDSSGPNNTDNKGENTRDSDDNNLPTVIYRFKFTEEFMEDLYKFSKIHQYDDRKNFKEAWKVWTEENESIIDEEMRRLLNLGYEGDVLDKMFKSARYYFRKKSTEKKEPRQRRHYISVNRDLLDAMDSHINSNLNENWYKPSAGFTEFCKEHIELLQQEVELLIKFDIVASDEIKKKIKKTYKNRYFMIIKNKNS